MINDLVPTTFELFVTLLFELVSEERCVVCNSYAGVQLIHNLRSLSSLRSKPW